MTKSDTQQVGRSLEAQLASELQNELRGLPVGAHFTVPPSTALCSSLELFLPRLLRRHNPEWLNESLDAIFVARATKTGPVAAQIVGTCILISDQTVTPFSVNLELSYITHSVATVRLLLGEAGGGKIGISGPRCNTREANQVLERLTTRLDSVVWAYRFSSE